MVIEGRPQAPADRRIVFANAAARELFRIRPEGGRLVSFIRHPEVLRAVDQALAGADTTAMMEIGGAQDRVWEATLKPLAPSPVGKLAMLALRDQTDVWRAERMRADFLANASHELRTPLASLSGFIETLRGHAKDDPDARERFLAIMQAQAERMARLIDDLLSLSRIELNEHIAPHGRVDLSVAVTDVTDALSPLIRAKAIQIEASLAGRGVAEIEGDRDQIVQVIQNLVDNAIKYTPEGGIIRISVLLPVERDTPPPAEEAGLARLNLLAPDNPAGRQYAVIKVADSGPGITRDRLPRLTERFYRVEGQKSGERSGTGLGLAIVKHILNRHKGGLNVASAEGRGTVFTAWFPLDRP